MTCCDSAVALEKASGSGVSAKKHIFSGFLARARERNTMLARAMSVCDTIFSKVAMEKARQTQRVRW